MKNKEDIFKRLYESFTKEGGRFHIMERRVSLEQQLEYFKFSSQVRQNMGSVKENDDEIHIKNLKNSQSTNDEKKVSLSILALSKQIKIYRFLENFVQETDGTELSDWAYMALTENRIALEFEFSGERQIYISSGLGGKGHKLRFHVVLFASQSDSFLDYQRKIIRDELAFALPKRDIDIERFTIEDQYVEIVILMPITTFIRKIIRDVIAECNQYGNFLLDTFIISNEKELGKKEIENVLEERKL
ncbi:MAG: hypothetical protein LBE91_13000 [Tannerella sp.]|nr:hypothetical protein [Tannerella sp.]